jgi:hypothetical protein
MAPERGELGPSQQSSETQSATPEKSCCQKMKMRKREKGKKKLPGKDTSGTEGSCLEPLDAINVVVTKRQNHPPDAPETKINSNI